MSELGSRSGQEDQGAFWTRDELGADPTGQEQYEEAKRSLPQEHLQKRQELFIDFPPNVVAENSDEALYRLREARVARKRQDDMDRAAGLLPPVDDPELEESA